MAATGGPKAKFERVADALREDIESGKLQPGERLPTQEALMKRFGYAGQTVQNGLAALRTAGLIVSAGNLGNFVAEGGVAANGRQSDVKEILSQLQALSERVAALERR